jgi:hypothetical protein
MSEMGKYCKAYLLQDLRKFSGWSEKAENSRQEEQVVNGQLEKGARQLNDDSIVYLQENYLVTDGIFKDENILFDDVTQAWIDYCQQSLKFEVPVYELVMEEGKAVA